MGLKKAKEVETDSRQTPHDPGATYGHKGKGYEVQVTETCTEGNEVNLITEIEVTPSCGSDIHATVPTGETLRERKQKPEELVGDTAYSSGENAARLAQEGVNLTAPVPHPAKPKEGKEYPAPVARCPAEEEEAREWLRQQEASPTFKKRYAIRAGIESTNAELNGAHGVGKLRVRGEDRVKLSVYFKGLGCNLKRALRA
ncbi:MAG: transposase [Planctomycetes bacterium]|nr:transposase [Planctomycetota bacterium]